MNAEPDKHESLIHNNIAAVLNVFKIKQKKLDISKPELVENNKNFVSKPKHYIPAIKEWSQSIYSYNKNTSKLLPSLSRTLFKLVKSYFNVYSPKLEIKSHALNRTRIRARRLSTNRILVSKPEVKHTNDKANITIHVYNRENRYYLNKINRIASLDVKDNLLSDNQKNKLIKTRGPWPSDSKIKVLWKKSIKVKSKIKKHENMVLKMLKIKNKTDINKFKNYEIKYLKDYVIKTLRKEIISIKFRQLLFFNKCKFDERYLLPFTTEVKKIYNKIIEFNFVPLKYLHLDSYIFSETLLTKIRNRKNRLLRVLKTSLLMFKLPLMDRTAVYDEIYNRKRKLQNLKVQDLSYEPLALQFNNKTQLQDDVLEIFLSKVDSCGSLSKLKEYKTYSPQNLTFSYYPLYLTNTILNSIKHKYVSGIRLEAAGRLTKRNTAARSVYKLRYKGSIKNMDSSYKGLPTVVLRGYAKSNLQYTKLMSKIRIGSFGLKGWVSSS